MGKILEFDGWFCRKFYVEEVVDFSGKEKIITGKIYNILKKLKNLIYEEAATKN